MRFIRPGGYSYEVFANKEVIVSAGAINSPHLLLLSGVGPKEELEKHQVREFNRDSLERDWLKVCLFQNVCYDTSFRNKSFG